MPDARKGREEMIDSIKGWKRCCRCGKIKRIGEYYFRKDRNTYWSFCKECDSGRHKEYYNNNAEILRKKSREFREKNKEEVHSGNKKWRVENRIYLNEYLKNRYYNDVQFNLKRKLRGKLKRALLGIHSDATTLDLVGCSVLEFKNYFGGLFTKDMDWKNVLNGQIHIDHIRPIASFNLADKTQRKKCFHYSNLQPLWAKDNILKGEKYALK